MPEMGSSRHPSPGVPDDQPRFHRPTPPRLLDPILTRWEQVDRRRRRIRPIRRNGVLGLEFGRYDGPPVVLSDGTAIHRGDPVAMVHIENANMRAVATSEWQTRGLAEARADLRSLADWAARQPEERRPVAYIGFTLMGPLARRVGFEVHPRPRTWRTRLDDWFLRWLMAHWSPGGRDRLRRGAGALRSSDVWLSHAALQRRYGAARRHP